MNTQSITTTWIGSGIATDSYRPVFVSTINCQWVDTSGLPGRTLRAQGGPVEATGSRQDLAQVRAAIDAAAAVEDVVPG